METMQKVNPSYWQKRHSEALRNPNNGFEQFFQHQFMALQAYAQAMRDECGTEVADDGYCGPEIYKLMQAVQQLLSGPTGNRLDCGSLDHNLRVLAKDMGFSDEEVDQL